MRVKLLDCTLRDGGFLNDWNFGRDSIFYIYQKLCGAGLDIVEIGYLRDNAVFNPDRTVFPDTGSIKKLFDAQKKTTVAAIIDYGDFSIENVGPRKDTVIDAIRVTFKKDDMVPALKFCEQIKSKGYKLFVQPVSVTSYSDGQMLDLIGKINKLNPYAMAIVDTYGLLHKEHLFRYFQLMNDNLNPEINIGYHSHNNFQLAYSNSIELLNFNADRTIILDASLYGMGKGAGNAGTELLAMYLNNTQNKKYDMGSILEIIDMEILKLRQKYTWGYQFNFYLSALNDCHPQYVKYLRDKNTLTVKAIDKILRCIKKTKKLNFDKNYIEELYRAFQNKQIDDAGSYKALSHALENRNILLIGPGKSVVEEKEKISDFIEDKKPVIFSLNHIPQNFKADYMFFSNAKRFEQYGGFLKKKVHGKIITTSNVATRHTDYVLDYNSLISPDEIVGGSSLVILINFLIAIKTTSVTLAGFDGFSKYLNNYYTSYLEFSAEDKSEVTVAVIKQLRQFRDKIKIDFLTKSQYL